MRLKRNYKFQMYKDSIKGQAPAAGQATDAHLRAHLPLPGPHSMLDSSSSEFSFSSMVCRLTGSHLISRAMRSHCPATALVRRQEAFIKEDYAFPGSQGH